MIVLLFSSSCATQAPRSKSKAAINTIPQAYREEIEMGEKINAAILSSFYPYTEPGVVAYVNQIGNSLAAHAERPLPYRFTVLYQEKIYATSAPGGFIYLTTGLLNFLDNEAELAAVIAHEIGELQYPDPRLSQSRRLLETLTRGGATIGPAFGEIGALAVLGLALMNSVVESQQLTPAKRLARADRWALNAMVQADYDPQGLVDLLHKFLAAEKQVMPYFFDYHQSRPITQDRFQNIQNEFAVLPLAGKRFSTHRETYQQMTKGIREMYRV